MITDGKGKHFATLSWEVGHYRKKVYSEISNLKKNTILMVEEEKNNGSFSKNFKTENEKNGKYRRIMTQLIGGSPPLPRWNRCVDNKKKEDVLRKKGEMIVDE